MRRLALACMIILLVAAGAFLALGILSADPTAQHRPGHVGCPPGSHGKSWSADAGRKFRDALDRRDMSKAESPPLESRGLTAGR